MEIEAYNLGNVNNICFSYLSRSLLHVKRFAMFKKIPRSLSLLYLLHPTEYKAQIYFIQLNFLLTHYH